MSSTQARALEEQYGSGAFQKFPVTLVRGSGALVWDQAGKEYVDCMAGYGVAITGHCNPWVVDAIKEQTEKLITCHGSFYNDARSEFLEKLAKVTPKGLEAALLTNSGTETVEAAIKLARRHTGRRGIVSMKGGFHGKTYGALSATWNKKYREPFGPLVPDFDFAEYGDPRSLESKVSQDTAAVIAEPIQGETGIIIPPPGYFKEVREICDRHGTLLILDEIQSGLGRTGRMWAGEHWGVVPDIMTISKGLGGGVPTGATVTRRDVMDSLKKGEHTSTFGGNPLSCAAASANLDYIVKNRLPEMAEAKGKELKAGLAGIANHHKIVRDARGLGLMRALELRVDVHHVLLDAIDRGVILAYAGRDVIRLLPPIVISVEQMRKTLEVLEETVRLEESRRFGQN
ncbi:MAG: aspartate aminotransferase family protein [Thaumarchaeota archaeon]|nr:aspartate aminotransferase family protein [Nitrososphaerota archaeon]